MNSPSHDPVRRAAAWLGYGGLIPFIVLAPASLLDHHHGWTWSDALYGYGAIILSFVGALHWGFRDERTGGWKRAGACAASCGASCLP